LVDYYSTSRIHQKNVGKKRLQFDKFPTNVVYYPNNPRRASAEK